ncbi:hypothetical protein WMF20_06070 [Sorangium sp. So ce834]|uniref:hypothetical protein n=1 Tax=Sorangium sp. So ce834 TaxID=3133321 RepID=UPI003F5E7886
MSDSESARQAAFSRTMASLVCLLDAMALFAAPKLAAKIGRVPPREGILEHLEAYLIIAPEMTAPVGDMPRQDTTPHALKLRELFSAWTPSSQIPQEIVQAAREFLEAFGIAGPDEGWDNFEGFPDDPQTQEGD